MAEPGAKEEDLQAIRVQFGPDKPLWTQYAVFITNAVWGDFGKSIYYRIPVFDLYLQRLSRDPQLGMSSTRVERRDASNSGHWQNSV